MRVTERKRWNPSARIVQIQPTHSHYAHDSCTISAIPGPLLPCKKPRCFLGDLGSLVPSVPCSLPFQKKRNQRRTTEFPSIHLPERILAGCILSFGRARPPSRLPLGGAFFQTTKDAVPAPPPRKVLDLKFPATVSQADSTDTK